MCTKNIRIYIYIYILFHAIFLYFARRQAVNLDEDTFNMLSKQINNLSWDLSGDGEPNNAGGGQRALQRQQSDPLVVSPWMWSRVAEILTIFEKLDKQGAKLYEDMSEKEGSMSDKARQTFNELEDYTCPTIDKGNGIKGILPKGIGVRNGIKGIYIYIYITQKGILPTGVIIYYYSNVVT